MIRAPAVVSSRARAAALCAPCSHATVRVSNYASLASMCLSSPCIRMLSLVVCASTRVVPSHLRSVCATPASRCDVCARVPGTQWSNPSRNRCRCTCKRGHVSVEDRSWCRTHVAAVASRRGRSRSSTSTRASAGGTPRAAPARGYAELDELALASTRRRSACAT